MILGVPKEIMENENRVAASPETVQKYIGMGWKVLVETRAGEGSCHSDEDYVNAGASIVYESEALFAQTDLVLKVKQPGFDARVGKHEIEMMREGSVLITFLHPAAPANHDMVRMLRDRGITAFTMDGIPRISRAQGMDALTSMSTVTGYKSVVIAAHIFPKLIPMMATAIGVIKPATFLVVGVGVVGLQAIATAKRLGGVVKAVDIRSEAREAAGSLGVTVAGFDVPPELAMGEGGYARALPAEWLAREREALMPILKEMDIVILSALVPGEVAPLLMTREMIEQMQPGSVIVDVSIDQGGNCQATLPGDETRVGGVTISGRMNIPGSIPVHATWLYANNIFEYVKNLYKQGVGKLDLDDEIVRHSLVTHRGEIVHRGALKAMGEG